MLKCQYEVMKARCGKDAARVYVTFFKNFSSRYISAAKCDIG